MRLAEHRRRAQGLADLLLYDSLVDDGVMLLQDGALLAAWWFRGPDMASATHGEMAALSARLNSILRLGAGWMIQCDSIRSRAPGYPGRGAFRDPVTRLIDDERREQFTAVGAHFENDYFLSLTYLPPEQTEERVKGWLFDGSREFKSSAEKILDYFKARVAGFEDVFGSLFEVRRLRDELLRYIHRCVTATDHLMARPEIPVYLSDTLATQDFVGGVLPDVPTP